MRNAAVLSDRLPIYIIYSIKTGRVAYYSLDMLGSAAHHISAYAESGGRPMLHIRVYEPLGCTVKHMFVKNYVSVIGGTSPLIHHPYGYTHNTIFLIKIQVLYSFSTNISKFLLCFVQKVK